MKYHQICLMMEFKNGHMTMHIVCKSNLSEAVQSMKQSNVSTDDESDVNTKGNGNNSVVNILLSITIAIKNKHFDCANVLCTHLQIIVRSLDIQSSVARDNV